MVTRSWIVRNELKKELYLVKESDWTVEMFEGMSLMKFERRKRLKEEEKEKQGEKERIYCVRHVPCR